jgi:tRNA nucleotidyltransferase (CCA-adding enzyme)
MPLRRAVREAGLLARERGERAYLVGGAVRDLLLGRPVRDADLALEGVASEFAVALAARLGAARTAHARFATATLELSGGSRLDVAATRRESYARSGALPRVEAGAPIEKDLARRDFTIHAMALELSPRARLLDPLGGREDLERRQIRFLHPDSPKDDPTRALRAVRYANRLAFAVAPETRRQIGEAIVAGAFDAVSGDRLRRELALILAEEGRARAPRLLRSLGVDRAIAPALALAARGASRRIERTARPGLAQGWFCYLLAWMAPSTPRELRQVADRLSFTGGEREILLRWPKTRRRLRAGLASLPPSKRRRLVRGLSVDEALAARALLGTRDARALAEAFAARDRTVLAISGADLLARGVEPGPAVGRALEAARAAREDGKIAADQELAFALAAARRRG